MTSLFEYPNENHSFNLNKCLMAKTFEDYAAGGSKWVLESGCTSHMTGGKDLVTTRNPKSEVLVLGKVVVAHNITLVDVMLVKTLGYNLMSIYALGKMGFVVFIDIDIVVLLWSKTLKVSFIGYTWVYFLKKKDETQQIFIDFATEVQRQHNLTILAIRSDNGSEFKNYTLNDFLSDEGIIHQYSAAYTPQQNGVAERKNQTLMYMARSMLFEYKSRYDFWAEAISTACHSSNRLYHRKGLNKTPYEILTGHNPNISYFRVFGYLSLRAPPKNEGDPHSGAISSNKKEEQVKKEEAPSSARHPPTKRSRMWADSEDDDDDEEGEEEEEDDSSSSAGYPPTKRFRSWADSENDDDDEEEEAPAEDLGSSDEEVSGSSPDDDEASDD
ncbi:hypothetical protein QYE76_032801 [Lolium multiflorum]|uniref:Integrase catalytic domain-containing protein n=1 Tax=Lolium multiflorum TaxID=4521 RepID=A0AAD8QUB4_LOLMU|nr:hypothetical protein QYE76_032801 [Lolium multiflorum]